MPPFFCNRTSKYLWDQNIISLKIIIPLELTFLTLSLEIFYFFHVPSNLCNDILSLRFKHFRLIRHHNIPLIKPVVKTCFTPLSIFSTFFWIFFNIQQNPSIFLLKTDNKAFLNSNVLQKDIFKIVQSRALYSPPVCRPNFAVFFLAS